MKVMAIDVGYSATKAVSVSGRVLIPSVVAPFRELPLADLSGNGSGYVTTIHRLSGGSSRHFVGDLAVREGLGATFTLDRDKHKHPNHDILVLTAARALGAAAGVRLVVGTPVAYYGLHKEELQRQLEGLHAEVSIEDAPPARVSFGEVMVYPQGAGALLMATDQPESGLVLMVEVGFKTTDYITAEVIRTRIRPVASLCGSIETGVYAVYEAVAGAYHTMTGAPIKIIRVPEITAAGGKTYYYGREIDLSGVLRAARDQVALTIADQVKSALGERMAQVRRSYLAGGGALELPGLEKHFPVCRLLEDPVWANAEGFLRRAERDV
jgi:plasmid segregation protein ParM